MSARTFYHLIVSFLLYALLNCPLRSEEVSFISNRSISNNPRNNFDGWVGMKFTVGPDPIVVTQLGRIVVPGNTGVHTLKLVRQTGLRTIFGLPHDTNLPGASVTIDLRGVAPGQFKYEPLPSPVILEARASYFLASSEIDGGDGWHGESDVTVTTTAVATCDGGIYNPNADGSWEKEGTFNQLYGPVDFMYLLCGEAPPAVTIQTPVHGSVYAPPATVVLTAMASSCSGQVTRLEYFAGTNSLGSASPPNYALLWTNMSSGLYALSARATDNSGQVTTSAVVQIRVGGSEEAFVSRVQLNPRYLNHFRGYIGMLFQVGPYPITVTELGRWVVPGNFERHELKLIRHIGGVVANEPKHGVAEIPNAFVDLDLSDETGGDYYRFKRLAHPVTLEAHGQYILASRETQNGDFWYEFRDVQLETTSAAFCLRGIYYPNESQEWDTEGTFRQAYGPVNFKYVTSPRLASSVIARTNRIVIREPFDVTFAGPYKIQAATSLGSTLLARPNWATLDTYFAQAVGERILDLPLETFQQRYVRALSSFVWLPPGTFLMGSPETEVGRESGAERQTEVTLQRGFWIGRWEVSQEEYLSVVGNNPSHFTNGQNSPVDSVSWHQATNYCRLLTFRERQAGRLPFELSFRLPFEAEWEFACRAGTNTTFSSGPFLEPSLANFDGRSNGSFLGRSSAVGSYGPNAWGIYDLHGNVSEWCLGPMGANLPGGQISLDNRTNRVVSLNGNVSVLRGGSWLDTERGCRAAARLREDSTATWNTLGFRVVLAPALP